MFQRQSYKLEHTVERQSNWVKFNYVLEKTCICHKTPRKQHHKFSFDFPTIFILSLPHELWIMTQKKIHLKLLSELETFSKFSERCQRSMNNCRNETFGRFYNPKVVFSFKWQKNTNGSWWNFCALSNEKLQASLVKLKLIVWFLQDCLAM